MRFSVVSLQPARVTAVSTTGWLVADVWDDYSYRTAFDLYLAEAGTQPEHIGQVKILPRIETRDSDGLMWSRLNMPPEFEELPPDEFVSLGQGSSYYSKLSKFSREVRDEALRSLHDVTHPRAEVAWWIQSRGYFESLLRLRSANQALRDAATLLQGGDATRDMENLLTYSRSGYSYGGPLYCEFRFSGRDAIPGRINVVVGKNGVGKTSLLVGLAKWLARPSEHNPKFTYNPEVSRVIYISFNTYDDVLLPSVHDQRDFRVVGHRPLSKAIRELFAEQTVQQSDEWEARLLTAFPGPAELFSAFGRAVTGEMRQELGKLAADADWNRFICDAIENDSLAELLQSDPAAAWDMMSAGQRVLVSLYAGIFVHLDRQSLLLIDEPESHLHPSLLSLFVRKLSDLLDARRAFAVIATHSPIVVQEIPARYISVLTRTGDDTSVSRPSFETFGESIDRISEYLFETDFKSSHWKRVLAGLILEGLDPEKVQERIGPHGLSLFARTYLEYEHIRHLQE